MNVDNNNEERNMAMTKSKSVTKDPICGVTVDEATSLHAERDGKTFYFCSEHCRQEFISARAGAKPDDKSGGSCCGNNTHTALSTAWLSPRRLGWAFGATGVVFYLGCMLTMAIVPRETAVVLFNGLLHGFNVDPILKTGVPVGEVALGLVTTFILGWFAGLYNLSLGMRKWK